MSFVPVAVTRFASRSLLKVNASSPTILVVAGVVGLGATAVVAARATRNIDPILDAHKKGRIDIESDVQAQTDRRIEQKALLKLYSTTSVEMLKLYGPTLALGTISAVSVLGGHKILRGRYVATMAAYSGLAEQFMAYRGRIAKTLGVEREMDIFNGAHGEWKEDPDHKGEYKLESTFPEGKEPANYLRPYFDEYAGSWTSHAQSNYAFLKGMQSHFNTRLNTVGHVFLNEIYDALRIPRTPEGAIAGWVLNNKGGDNYIDFGFMVSNEPQAIAFRNGSEPSVRLNFNIDPGAIWEKI